jgi:hypothetical protein
MKFGTKKGLVTLSLATVGITKAFAGGMIVPAYFYPNNGGIADRWYQLAAAANYLSLNGVGGYNTLIAVMNPNSGPAAVADANYTSAITKVRQQGGKVVAYVWTNNSLKPYSQVAAEIQTYITQYGSQLDGFFLDDWRGYLAGNIPGVTPAKTYSSYATQIKNLIKNTYGKQYVIANPGVSFNSTATNPSQANLADIFCLHENTYAAGVGYTLPAWLNTAAHAQKGAVLIHAMPANQQVLATQVIQNAKYKKAKWIFTTDDSMPSNQNPWDTLPGEESGGIPNDWNSYWGNVQYSVAISPAAP